MQHHLTAPSSVAQRMEVRCPVVAGNNRLAVDQKRRCLEVERGINDGRETIGPVMTALGEAADAGGIPEHHQPIAVMFDFVNP